MAGKGFVTHKAVGSLNHAITIVACNAIVSHGVVSHIQANSIFVGKGYIVRNAVVSLQAISVLLGKGSVTHSGVAHLQVVSSLTPATIFVNKSVIGSLQAISTMVAVGNMIAGTLTPGTAINFYTHVNLAQSYVTVARDAYSSTLTVQDASLFAEAVPPPSTTNPLRVSVRRGQVPLCILEVTGISGNTMTVVGAIEGTTDVNMIVGDQVWSAPTAGDLTDIQNAVNALESVWWTRSFVFMLGVGVPVVVGTNVTNALINVSTGTIEAVYMYAKTPPTSVLQIQLNVNGNPIWSEAQQLQLLPPQQFASTSAFTIANINPGDLVTIDVDQAGGASVTVAMVVGYYESLA